MSDAPEALSPSITTNHETTLDSESAAMAVQAPLALPASVSVFMNAQQLVPRRRFFAQLFGRPPVPHSLRKEYRTARGEVAVIDVLSRLGSQWMVRTCQAAECNGVEHIVIGPPGAFCMVVRHHTGGAVWIDGGVLLADGERMPHLRDTEFNAVRLTQQLSDSVGFRVDVTPCLVLVEPRSVTVSKPPRRVAVMTVRDIRTWLKGMPSTLSLDEVSAVQQSVAAHPDWVSMTEQHTVSADAIEGFRRVHADVGQARHIRLSWVTGALVLLWLIAVVSVGGIATSFLVN